MYGRIAHTVLLFRDGDTLMSIQLTDALWTRFLVRVEAPEYGVSLSLVVTRTQPVLLHHGTGIIGNLPWEFCHPEHPHCFALPASWSCNHIALVIMSAGHTDGHTRAALHSGF
jgi:hypothetical protein